MIVGCRVKCPVALQKETVSLLCPVNFLHTMPIKFISVLRSLEYVWDGRQKRCTIFMLSKMLQALLDFILIIVGKIFSWGITEFITGVIAALVESGTQMIPSAMCCHLFLILAIKS